MKIKKDELRQKRCGTSSSITGSRDVMEEKHL